MLPYEETPAGLSFICCIVLSSSLSVLVRPLLQSVLCALHCYSVTLSLTLSCYTVRPVTGVAVGGWGIKISTFYMNQKKVMFNMTNNVGNMMLALLGFLHSMGTHFCEKSGKEILFQIVFFCHVFQIHRGVSRQGLARVGCTINNHPIAISDYPII